MLKTICTLAVAALFVPAFGHAEPQPAPQTGLNPALPLDTKLFKTTKDYFKARIPKKIYTAFKDGRIPTNWGKDVNSMTPEKCVEYNAAEESTVLYVPATYDGSAAFGVYLHNSPGGQGIQPSAEWQALMDKLKLIYISPNRAQNESPAWRRIVLAMDSLATVKAHYKIDANRAYVGGWSGGGHVGMLCQMLYPEYFQGAISHAAQSYLPAPMPGGGGGGHFPGLTLADAKSELRKQRKWAVIFGDKDGNYQAILDTSKQWKDERFQYKPFFVKGMEHENASAAALEEALVWMGADQKPKKPADDRKP